MATDEKISQLSSGNPAQSGDLIPIDRSGSNFAVTAGSIAALAQASATSLFGNVHGWTVNIGTSQLDNYGDGIGSPIIGTSLWVPATAGFPQKLRVTSQAVGGGQGLIQSAFSSTPNANLNGLSFWKMRTAIAQISGSDEWYAGLCDVNVHSTYIQTTPTTQNVCAFRYIGGQANFTACCCDANGTSTIVDTGIAIDTAMHTFLIVPNSNGSSIQFYIDGVLGATINTHVPTSNVCSTLSLKANAQIIDFEYLWYGYTN